MKVLVNVEPTVTGIGQYTKHLVAGLHQNTHISHVACFDQYKIADCSSLVSPVAGSKRKLDKLRQFLRQVPGAYQLRSKIRNQLFTNATSQHFSDAIYHEPNYILKPFLGKSVTTIHDLSHFHYPQFHPRERVLYMERELPKTLSRASHIITDSQYVKDELISIMNVNPQCITAIPLGVSPQFYPRSEVSVQTVMRKYHLKYGQYLLAVATFEPRKNLYGLITAYMRLPMTIRRRYPLILVGGQGWKYRQLEKLVDKLQAAGEICRLGYLSVTDLAAIYSGARAFAFPSYYEGFGLPPLEAMASGIPVLTSANSAMAEVVSAIGIMVDPYDNDSIFVGLKKLLLDDSFRQLARRAGLKRATHFTWQQCVEQTVSVYRYVKDER